MVFTVFALDHIFKELLSLLKNHAEIEIKQEGIHVLAIQVTGDGFLAKLIRRVVKDVSVRKKIDTKHFTKRTLSFKIFMLMQNKFSFFLQANDYSAASYHLIFYF